jgi:hypothetical protein
MTHKTIKENDSWVNPGAPAERSFIGFHRANVAHIDPTDPDVATNNDPVFNGSNVRTYERSVNRMGYDRDDDYNHYDNFRAWRDGQLAAIRRYSTGQQAIVPYDQHNSKHDDWVRGFTSVSRMFEQVAEEQGEQLDESLKDWVTRPITKAKSTIRGMRGHGMKDYMRGEGMPSRDYPTTRKVALAGRRMKDHMDKVHAGIGNTIAHWDNAIKSQAANLQAFSQATDRLKGNLERYAGHDLVGVHAAALAAKYHPNLYKRPDDTSHKRAVQRAYKQLSLMRKADGLHPLDNQHPNNETYTKALVRGHTATSLLKTRTDESQKAARNKRRRDLRRARKDQ